MGVLVAAGFPLPDVLRMPLAILWSELALAQRRTRNRQASDVILMHAAMIDVLSERGGHLSKALDRLNG